MKKNVHNYFMALALREAEKAYSKKEVPVGAVLVRDGRIIARAHNCPVSLNDPTAHAEINLLRRAGKKLKNYRLNGTTLYVTVEPCPMCAGAIINARIGTVVYGAEEMKWGAGGSVFQILRNKKLNHRVRIIRGIMEEECKSILQKFFKEKRKGGF
jgi:tRNA(adenine34) deaminase